MLFEIDGIKIGSRRDSKLCASAEGSRGSLRVVSARDYGNSSESKLNLAGLKSHGVKINQEGRGKYKILASGLSKGRIISQLKAFNDIEISYSDDLEDNDLIKTSKKPLWALEDNGNGTFTIQRSFKK